MSHAGAWHGKGQSLEESQLCLAAGPRGAEPLGLCLVLHLRHVPRAPMGWAALVALQGRLT